MEVVRDADTQTFPSMSCYQRSNKTYSSISINIWRCRASKGSNIADVLQHNRSEEF